MRLLGRTGTSCRLADSKSAGTAKDKELPKIGDELRDIPMGIQVCVVYEVVANRFKDTGEPTSIGCCHFESDVRPITGRRVSRSPPLLTRNFDEFTPRLCANEKRRVAPLKP